MYLSLCDLILPVLLISLLPIDLDHKLLTIFALPGQLILQDGEILLQLVGVGLRLIQLKQTIGQLLNLPSNLILLLPKQLHIPLHQLNIVCRCDVVHPLQFPIHLIG